MQKALIESRYKDVAETGGIHEFCTCIYVYMYTGLCSSRVGRRSNVCGIRAVCPECHPSGRIFTDTERCRLAIGGSALIVMHGLHPEDLRAGGLGGCEQRTLCLIKASSARGPQIQFFKSLPWGGMGCCESLEPWSEHSGQIQCLARVASGTHL